MTCPRCHQWQMRRGYDGDLECFCGHVEYEHPPLDYAKAVQEVQARKVTPRMAGEGHATGRATPSYGQFAQVSFGKSFK